MPDKHEVGGSSPLGPTNFSQSEKFNRRVAMISSEGLHHKVISSVKQISLTFVST